MYVRQHAKSDDQIEKRRRRDRENS